jgi:hypothetical protein
MLILQVLLFIFNCSFNDIYFSNYKIKANTQYVIKNILV